MSMKLIPKCQKGNTIEQDAIKDSRPTIYNAVERKVGNRYWSQLAPKERFKNRPGFNNGRPIEKGLEIVSPEFDILTGVRGLSNLPKGFLKGSGRIDIKPDSYYRQIDRIDKGIERAKQVGVIDTKSTILPDNKIGGISLRKKTFEVPFFSKGNLWYGRQNKYDVIVGKDSPNMEWMPITQKGGFRPDAKGIEDAYVRTTPLINGQPNKAPTSNFEFYRNYPVIGMRNVTNGLPTMPITGLNTITKINQK